jgi:Cys-rich four helix bundle protein (predicted Tat secretion target)
VKASPAAGGVKAPDAAQAQIRIRASGFKFGSQGWRLRGLTGVRAAEGPDQKEEIMDRREFIAAAGTAAAVTSASQAFAQGMMGAETEEPMHPPKYKALEKTAAKCVETGNDCLRHCYGMFKMKDTSMAACADAAFQLVAACGALDALAAVNSEHTGHLAKTVAMVCRDCKEGMRQVPENY